MASFMILVCCLLVASCYSQSYNSNSGYGRPRYPWNGPPRYPGNGPPREPWNGRPSEPWNGRPSEPWNERPSEPWNERPSEPDKELPSKPGNERPSEPGNGRPSTGQLTTRANTVSECKCTVPRLECVDAKTKGDTAKCPTGYWATSCSCAEGCGTYSFPGSDTCKCECYKPEWTSARCCKNV